METPPVYSDARIQLLVIKLTATHIGSRLLVPCYRPEFMRSITGVLLKVTSEYERKMRAKDEDLKMTMHLCRAFGAENQRQRDRIAELEQIVTDIPASAWQGMADVHV